MPRTVSSAAGFHPLRARLHDGLVVLAAGDAAADAADLLLGVVHCELSDKFLPLAMQRLEQCLCLCDIVVDPVRR